MAGKKMSREYIICQFIGPEEPAKVDIEPFLRPEHRYSYIQRMLTSEVSSFDCTKDEYTKAYLHVIGYKSASDKILTKFGINNAFNAIFVEGTQYDCIRCIINKLNLQPYEVTVMKTVCKAFYEALRSIMYCPIDIHGMPTAVKFFEKIPTDEIRLIEPGKYRTTRINNECDNKQYFAMLSVHKQGLKHTIIVTCALPTRVYVSAKYIAGYHPWQLTSRKITLIWDNCWRIE